VSAAGQILDQKHIPGLHPHSRSIAEPELDLGREVQQVLAARRRVEIAKADVALVELDVLRALRRRAWCRRRT
jgi:hypothetical protein